MNAYEIEQIEKDVRANFRLPLSYEGWADVERRAREERARILGQGLRKLTRALYAKVAGILHHARATAADCTDARLRHG